MMQGELPQTKIARFEKYNFERRASGRSAPKFHDNDVRSIAIIPAQRKGRPSIVEILFHDREENIERMLRLAPCVNLRFSIDFDVLSANTSSAKTSAGQTSNVEIGESEASIERLIREGRANCNTDYPSPTETPGSSKFSQLHKFVLVKVILHGGTLEIVARDFSITDQAIRVSR
jgi:hypothetical protein